MERAPPLPQSSPACSARPTPAAPRMDPAPAQFFCLTSPPGLGCSHKACQDHLLASLDKALSLDAKLVDITEVAHLPALGAAVGVRRSEFVFALRFGRKGKKGLDSSPQAVRRTCERALAACNIGYVDLLYQEEEDPDTPMERTMWELKELKLEGKVRYIGLAVSDTELLKRACTIHPLACVCLEWSLWKPRSLDKVVSVARDYGLAILAKDPLGGNGDLSFPANSKQDTATISCKISELLDRQSSALLSLAKEMTEYPEEGLEGKISSISAGQDYSLANSLSQILDEHLRTMERAFRWREEWASCARTIRRASMSQNASFVGRMLTVTVNQRKQLLTKMDNWTGRLHSDGATVGAFRSLVQTQSKCFVTRFCAIRKEQNDDLRKIASKISEDTEFKDVLDGMLTKHTDELNRWITIKKENLTADLMVKLHDLRKHWISSVKGQLLRTRREQNCEVLQGISPILGDGSKALETAEDVLQSNTSILESSFIDADFGGKPHLVMNKIEKLVKQQSSDMANKLSVLIEKERASSTPHNDKALKSTSSSIINSYNPIEAALHVRSVVSNRIRAVAQQRGCCEQQIALAWMVSQGPDVLPIVPVKNPREMVSVVKGTKMSLTDEEMVILYAGADVLQDDRP